MHFRQLLSTLKRPKTLMKMESFENGFKSGASLKTHRFVSVENGGFYQEEFSVDDRRIRIGKYTVSDENRY